MGDLGQVRDARPIRHMAVTIKIRVSSAITEMNAQSLVVAESAATNAPSLATTAIPRAVIARHTRAARSVALAESIRSQREDSVLLTPLFSRPPTKPGRAKDVQAAA